MGDDTNDHSSPSLEEINFSVFRAYDRECKRLAECIRPLLPIAGSDDETLDGYEWCEEHGIPLSAFAYAVEYHLPNADYGVSVMYPWVYDDDYLEDPEGVRGDR